MSWDPRSINKPHLVYIILGGFTSFFMLCSSIIKERLYIGEATVATLCGIIFGPHAANLIVPQSWGNVDQITLEFSRVVLVVQCFAVGVELPRAYMEKHWKSLTFLLVPVMAFGWLATSLFVWWMFLGRLTWVESLAIAACVTATDPVLASAVVGKGKFSRRVPKHLRDLLSAESGCNDGMAFPFIYLPLYILLHQDNAKYVAMKWICVTILYECVLGSIYGFLVGYCARRAIRYAHEQDWVDRESFLVFYFVLALFCAGSGSMLGMDDLLVGFAAGIGFSNDGWFQEKTEESHVSNVIDLLLNLAFFVYFGTIIPWEQFNQPIIGTSPWKLVVISILVLFFRRIPAMLALKPFIPDVKTWREALFAGHFGPMGVGAIFVAILARAQLETQTTTPLDKIPPPGTPHINLIELIWPVVTFIVIASIVVHGSSIAVFTLGKHINTLTLTLSYTQGVDDPSWMERLPRIQSRSRTSFSVRRASESELDLEKASDFVSGPGSPMTLPASFLRRQKEEEGTSGSRASSRGPFRRKKWDAGIGPGGPISRSAILPASRMNSYLHEMDASRQESVAQQTIEGTTAADSQTEHHKNQPQAEVYQEGNKIVIEDEEGNVLDVKEAREALKSRGTGDHRSLAAEKAARSLFPDHAASNTKQESVERRESAGSKQPDSPTANGGNGGNEPSAQGKHRTSSWWRDFFRPRSGRGDEYHPRPPRRSAARAYTFGHTVIVEDEDGEVIKQYDLDNDNHHQPFPGLRRPSEAPATGLGGSSGEEGGGALHHRDVFHRMGAYFGHDHAESSADAARRGSEAKAAQDEDDKHIRFTITDISAGRRLSHMRKEEFIEELQKLDRESRARMLDHPIVEQSLKGRRDRSRSRERDPARSEPASGVGSPSTGGSPYAGSHEHLAPPGTAPPTATSRQPGAQESHPSSSSSREQGPTSATQKQPDDETRTSPPQPNPPAGPVPIHSINRTLQRFSFDRRQGRETAADRRRREHSPSSSGVPPSSQAGWDGASDEPGARRAGSDAWQAAPAASGSRARGKSYLEDDVETEIERWRREGALGMRKGEEEEEDSSSEEEGPAGGARGAGVGGMRLRWGDDVGRKP